MEIGCSQCVANAIVSHQLKRLHELLERPVHYLDLFWMPIGRAQGKASYRLRALGPTRNSSNSRVRSTSSETRWTSTQSGASVGRTAATKRSTWSSASSDVNRLNFNRLLIDQNINRLKFLIAINRGNRLINRLRINND